MPDSPAGRCSLSPHPRKGIYVDAAAVQYATRVGYELNQAAKRVRSLQRLTADPEEATVRHIRLQQDWKKLKGEWPRIRGGLGFGLPQHLRHADLSKPIWIAQGWREQALAVLTRMQEETQGNLYTTMASAITEMIESDRQTIEWGKTELRKVIAEDPDALDGIAPALRDRVIAALRSDQADLRAGVKRGPTLTVEQAKKKFLESFEARIGKGSRYGRSVATYNTLKRELERCLEPLDTSRQVGHLTIADVRALCGYWTDLEAREVGGRTAENRINAFRQFLRAMDEDESYDFQMPRGAMTAFNECKAHRSEERITKIDIQHLKSVLRCLNDEGRLYVLLALNCGMYPEDISALTPAALVDERGQPHDGGREAYLRWRRSKTKRVNQFHAFHWLWPETAKLLQQCRAPANAHGRLLVNAKGTPLTSIRLGKGRTDTIGRNYRRRCKDANIASIPLMQLRKWGATAIARIGGIDVQMMYRAERPKGSSNDYVLLDFVGKLTPALKLWRRELAAARVFQWDRSHPTPTDRHKSG